MVCSMASFGAFSMVSTVFPSTRRSSVTHERVSLPSTRTLHAPQCPVPQASFVPFMHLTFRRNSSSVRFSPSCTSTDVPLSVNRIIGFRPPCRYLIFALMRIKRLWPESSAS